MTTSGPPPPLMVPTFPRGSLVSVVLEGRGREPSGEHYAVVVSSDTVNEGNRIVVVVPVRPLRGRRIRIYEVLIPKGTLGLPEDHAAVPAQITSLDVSKRVRRNLGMLDSTSIMAPIGLGLFACLGGLP